MTTYAIIRLGGKQYRVREGQRLLVDRLPYEESATFHPTVLFVGGDGKADFSPKDGQVTARVVQSVLGEKIRIGKYRPKTGYRRHRGHRSRLTEVEITAVGPVQAEAERPARAAQAQAARKRAGAAAARSRKTTASEKGEAS